MTVKETKPESRRTFIHKLWMGLGIVAGVEFLYILIKYFDPYKKYGEPIIDKSYFEAGKVNDFKVGSITSFSSRKFFLSRTREDKFLAISTKCTHLGCSLTCDENESLLRCPCHSSTFDITGRVLKSPATRSLDQFEVKIENGTVKVNTSAIINQRGRRQS